MGKKPKKKKGNINNLLLVCNVGSQKQRNFLQCLHEKKGRKELEGNTTWL